MALTKRVWSAQDALRDASRDLHQVPPRYPPTRPPLSPYAPTATSLRARYAIPAISLPTRHGAMRRAVLTAGVWLQKRAGRALKRKVGGGVGEEGQQLVSSPTSPLRASYAMPGTDLGFRGVRR
eukprot:1116444-Rhodomonas_salina.1